MVGIQCWLTVDEHQALKLYAIQHGYKSKAEAAAKLLEEWLVWKGYLEPEEIDPLLGDGYEYLEDA